MSECPSITKLRGATALHYAVRFDNFLFAEFLLSKGAKITVDNGGDAATNMRKLDISYETLL